MKSELTEYLRDHGESFDLIVSADTLVYFGDLTGVIAALGEALRPNGLVVFTLERTVADSSRCGLPSATARPLQSRARLCRAVACVFGPAVEDHPSRLAYGGRCAGPGAGGSRGEVWLGASKVARASSGLGASRMPTRSSGSCEMRTFRLVIMPPCLHAVRPPWLAMSRRAAHCARSTSAPIRRRRCAIRRPAKSADLPMISPANWRAAIMRRSSSSRSPARRRSSRRSRTEMPISVSSPTRRRGSGRWNSPRPTCWCGRAFSCSTARPSRRSPISTARDRRSPGRSTIRSRLCMKRILRQATVVELENNPAELSKALTARTIDALGANRQRLTTIATATPGTRLLPDDLFNVPQNIVVPKDRPAALAAVNALIDEARRLGLVAECHRARRCHRGGGGAGRRESRVSGISHQREFSRPQRRETGGKRHEVRRRSVSPDFF